MSDKAIIVADMPESCSKCKFMYEFYGVKKCQLLNVLKNGGKAIICVDKLNVARKECCPLVSAEEHDKEIRDKAIEEFCDFLHGKAKENNGLRLSSETRSWTHASIYYYLNEFKEKKMKEVGE